MNARAGLRVRALVMLAVVATCVSGGAARAETAAPPAVPFVQTLAGSGASGVADGAPKDAQFVLPMGIAEDARGNVYVADAGAKRIKIVGRDGRTATVAGGGAPVRGGTWVEGDFRDGPAAAARFRLPVAVAFDRRGTLYVADAEAHCIRTLSGGVVKTFAGSATQHGGALGPLERARFERPVALAVNAAGEVFVADEILGIRKIARGTVTAFPAKVDRPSGISLFENADGMTMAVADARGIVLFPPVRAPIRVPLHSIREVRSIIGAAPLGFPFGLALTSPSSLVYTDARTHTVHYLAGLEPRVVAGDPDDLAENEGGGLRDGAGTEARFFAPTGILARGGGGGFVVADTGNRVLRALSEFDVRRFVYPPKGETPVFDRNFFNVVLLGNSFVWFDTDYRTSIGGLLESELARSVKAPKPIRVITIQSPGFSTQAVESYARELLGELRPDFVVYFANSGTMGFSYARELAVPGNAGHVVDLMGASLARTASALQDPSRMVVAIHPESWEFAPTEATYIRFFEKFDAEWITPTPAFHQELRAAVLGAKVPLLDLWSAFAAAEAAPDRLPLFGTENEHFAPAGRALVAHELAAYLAALKPWERK